MYTLYKLTNTTSGREYAGMTKVGLEKRWKQHVNSKRSLPLYQAIKKYGPEVFTKEVVGTYETKEECIEAERRLISLLKNPYNLAPGGEGGFVVSDIEAWREKLRKARKGRKPALGMKHTDENKKLFSECSKRKALKYPKTLPSTFKEAKDLLGISKTHYYRMVKRADTNEVC